MFLAFSSHHRITRKLVALGCVFLLFPLTSFAAGGGFSSVQEILIALAYFLQNIILPFLFSIAFLYFLINLARYFIIEGANEKAHEQARSQAIYGIAAFVFLFSLWGIVTMVATGLNVTGYAPSCPDFVQQFGGTCNTSVSFGGNTKGSSFGTFQNGQGSYTGGTNQYQGGSNSYTGGSNSASGGTNSYTGQTTQNSGLANLVYGTKRDSAIFAIYPGAPRAINGTPSIGSTATCQVGLTALQQASQTYTTEAAYAFYRDANGTGHWQNLTDVTANNNITYDKDTLDSIMQTTSSRIYVVTLHPESRARDLQLTMNGEGPTAANLAAMCTSGHVSNLTFVTIDDRGVWSVTPGHNTCPYTASSTTQLSLIETWNDLAMLDPTTRNSQLANFVTNSLVPAAAQTYFTAYQTTDLSALSPEAVMAFAEPLKAQTNTTIDHTNSIDGFCSGISTY